MHKLISMDFQTCRDLQKHENELLKKRVPGRGGGSEPGRPKPGGLLGPGGANRYATIRSRSEGAGIFFLAGLCMHASQASLARVCEGGAYRGCFGGRRGLVRWRRRSDGGPGPGDAHARAAEVEVKPRPSRQTPAEGGDGDGYDMTWTKRRGE
jgi:hypothetical protein